MTGLADPPRILIGASTLFSHGGPVPHPLAKSWDALDRLRELGEPVVLVSRDLGGRPLPQDALDRVAWVSDRFSIPWLNLVAFDEPEAGRLLDPAARQADARWADLRSTWRADTLLTSFESSVGAARRAGLAVIRIGARGSGADRTRPRADYEAVDLLDAVRHMVFADAFAGPAGEFSSAGGTVEISGGSSPAITPRPDVLKGG
jgi:hypothetical protein